MPLKIGLKGPILLWSVILLAKEASSHTATQNLFSNLQQNLQGKTRTKEVYGGLDRTDWNAVRKKSLNGAYKKQLNPHRVLAGVRQATPEVYDHSYWIV
jgi:hypothetical protein